VVSFNRVVLAGNLTRDPELRFTNDGIPVCSFGLAVNRVRSRSEEVDFFDISAWRELGETVANYKKKGDPILLEGRLQYRTWDSDDGATSGGGGGQARRGGGRGDRREEVDINEEDFEDIPFRYFSVKSLIARNIL
jgi:single-strand DNA-binding protein